MWRTATDVVCSVCLCVDPTGDPCKNGSIDLELVWGVWAKELCIICGPDLPTRRSSFERGCYQNFPALCWPLFQWMLTSGFPCTLCTSIPCNWLAAEEVGCHVKFSQWKLCPMRRSLSSKFIDNCETHQVESRQISPVVLSSLQVDEV